MATRRHFISAAALAAAAGFAGGGTATPAEAAAPKGPSAFALAQAQALSNSMPAAHLSNDLIDKIASDIDGYASVAADFRKTTLKNWDEPDFTFVAGPTAVKR